MISPIFARSGCPPADALINLAVSRKYSGPIAAGGPLSRPRFHCCRTGESSLAECTYFGELYCDEERAGNRSPLEPKARAACTEGRSGGQKGRKASLTAIIRRFAVPSRRTNPCGVWWIRQHKVKSLRPHAPFDGRKTRALRNPGANWSGWHGRSVEGPGQPPGPPGRHQSWRRTLLGTV